MKARPEQARAAATLARYSRITDVIAFRPPTGFGTSITLAEMARRIDKPIAYASRVPEIRRQMEIICERIGVTNVTTVHPSSDLSRFDTVIQIDSPVQHKRVVRVI